MENNSVNYSNSKRIFYLDFARGLAVFFMIMQHAMIMHERTAGEGNTILGNIFICLGTAPAAPVFILIMGIFFVQSKKSIKENIIRGCKLFAFGYVLNLIRFTFPLLLAGGSYNPGQGPISLLFLVDIFQLTGLSLIFFSVFKKYADNLYILPTVILIILLVSPYLWGLQDHIFIFNPLWGAGKNTDFPLFPWAVYFLLGMYLSKHLQKQTLEKQIKKKLILSSLFLGTIGIATISFFPIGDYYRSGLSIHFLMMSFIFLWLPLSDYLVAKLIKRGCDKLLNTIYFWSKNVTGVYIIQWIIFGWSILLLGANQMTDYVAMIIGFIVLLITHFSLKYTKLKYFLPKL